MHYSLFLGVEEKSLSGKKFKSPKFLGSYGSKGATRMALGICAPCIIHYAYQIITSMSYLFNSQWTTDTNERKHRHMPIIPFPVCAYAAICYEERCQMDDWII